MKNGTILREGNINQIIMGMIFKTYSRSSHGTPTVNEGLSSCTKGFRRFTQVLRLQLIEFLCMMCYLGLLHLQACYPAENKNLIVRYT